MAVDSVSQDSDCSFQGHSIGNRRSKSVSVPVKHETAEPTSGRQNLCGLVNVCLMALLGCSGPLGPICVRMRFPRCVGWPPRSVGAVTSVYGSPQQSPRRPGQPAAGYLGVGGHFTAGMQTYVTGMVKVRVVPGAAAARVWGGAGGGRSSPWHP